ncbi:MAG TPA: Bax inhibitor-1 family protein [Gemmataceae bacterium]|nr:Bax inhibitor-1 family protein [Gemmataceae bacterium]
MNYAMEQPIAIRATESERAGFIRRTYGHLAGAILAFIILEFGLLHLPNVKELVMGMVSSPVAWLVVVGAYMGVSFLAELWARSNTSPGLQYLGLGLYVLAIGVVFLPLLYMAAIMLDDPKLILNAGLLTLCMFGGLTLAVFTTRKDFSFLGPILWIGGFLAFGAVIAFAFIGGTTFGLVIAFAMVALTSVSILYQTSNVIHHYRTDQHVAAALALFAAVATMFYYILWILMASRE